MKNFIMKPIYLFLFKLSSLSLIIFIVYAGLMAKRPLQGETEIIVGILVLLSCLFFLLDTIVNVIWVRRKAKNRDIKQLKRKIQAIIALCLFFGYLLAVWFLTYSSLLMINKVSFKNLDYITISNFKNAERYKINSQDYSQITMELIRTIKYLPSPQALSLGIFDRGPRFGLLIFHLKDQKEVILKVRVATGMINDEHFNKKTTGLINKIIQKKIGLYQGAYLMSEPQTLKLNYNNQHIEIDQANPQWPIIVNFGQKFFLKTRAIPQTDLKLWAKRFQELSKNNDRRCYLIEFCFRDMTKISTSRHPFLPSKTPDFNMFDDFGAPAIMSKKLMIAIFVQEGLSLYPLYETPQSGEKRVLVSSWGEGSDMHEDIQQLNQILTIFDKYQPPTAEIKGFEKDQ